MTQESLAKASIKYMESRDGKKQLNPNRAFDYKNGNEAVSIFKV